MAASDTLINTLFDGRYRVLRKLGRGGMADVYLAEDEELGRRVAIKILNERHAADDQFIERFRREATNAAGLSHPNIVSIYDRGEAEGTYYIAMEYLEGSTLKDIVLRGGPLPVEDAIAYTRDVLNALRFAHRKGIVHRDIKPHNVLVDSDERVKVTDFGIARAGASQMTEAGSIIGTAQYLSPEQARGGSIDQRSDLYSVGIVLYEVLTGTVPFSGDTPVEIAMKHLSAVPEAPSARRPDLPPALDQIVLRALAKDPEDRYQTAEEMDAELARVAEGLPVSTQTAEAATAVLSGAGLVEAAPTAVVRPPSPAAPHRPPPQPPGRGYYYEEPPPRGRPFWPWLLVLLLLVAAGGAVWLAWGKIQDELEETKTVAVPNVEGIREILAVRRLREQGFEPKVKRIKDEQVPEGFVISQDPPAGNRAPKGQLVIVRSSAGAPETEVPDVVGKSFTDAVQILADAQLKAKPFEVPSQKQEGTVVAQAPKPGGKVKTSSTVRINISKGPEQVVVPVVIGQLYDDAAAQLQQGGFAVARVDVDDNEPKGVVVGQNPQANTAVAKGSKVTLSVSKGPTALDVPDVLGLDEAAAQAELAEAGFQVRVSDRETDDEAEDGTVVDQRPAALTPAKPGSTVTIFIGRFLGVGPGNEPPPPTSP
ncbi:MAG: Stk1 family PASTA domain-containing Ser/Thr kinase [Gaiellaceae bacterium]